MGWQDPGQVTPPYATSPPLSVSEAGIELNGGVPMKPIQPAAAAPPPHPGRPRGVGASCWQLLAVALAAALLLHALAPISSIAAAIFEAERAAELHRAGW